MDVDGSNFDTLYHYAPGGMGKGIDVDEANGHIYFSNEQTDSIYRMDLNGANLTSIYGGTVNVGHLGSIKVDPVNSHIYFGEWLFDQGIYRINYNGTNEVTIVPTGEILELYVDQPNGHIYYSRAATGNTDLRRCDLNGSNDVSLLSGASVVGFDIDFSTATIYFTDQDLDRVASCDLTGSNVQTLVYSTDIYFGGDPLESPQGPVLVYNANPPCIPADTPVISAAGGPFCQGDSILITWTGNLNDNLEWEVLDDESGYTYFTSANSITIPAAEYGPELYINGTGNCTNGNTGQLDITNVYPVSQEITTQRICPGDSILIWGNYESTAGLYTDTLQSVFGCDSLLSIDLIIDPLFDQSIALSQTIFCDSGVVTVTMDSSEVGVDYYLRDASNMVIDGPFSGNGSGMTFSTGMVTSSTDYHVYGERTSSHGVHLTTGYDHMDGGNAATFQQNNVSFEFWVKWDGDTNGDKTMLLNGNEGYNGCSIKLYGPDSSLYVLFGGVGYLYTNTQLIPDTWTHIAVTGDASNFWAFYLDGDSIASTTIVPNPPHDVFHIGAATNGLWSQFDGTIDDVRVWEIARTEAEIQANMTNCLTGSEPNLKAYYTFENAGEDMTSNNFDLDAEGNSSSSPEWWPGVDHCSLGCGEELSTVVSVIVPVIDPTISISGITITANQTGATYQWLDCNNGNTPISGETDQSFTPSANGSYAVEITVNGCSDTTACENITTIGFSENTLDMSILTYPNPNAGKFYVEISGSTSEVFAFEMCNNLGQIVYSGEMEAKSTHLVEVTGIAAGIYTIRIGNENKESHKRIIIK